MDKYCYLNTVKEGKTFCILDQTRAEAVRVLQEQYGFSSDKDFIHKLEYNTLEGVDFSRRDVNMANKIYDYSKGTTMGRFKHPRKGVKMDRTTKVITVPVSQEIMKRYKEIHLDIDILFVNKTAFLLAISRDIGFVHFKPMAFSVTKQVQNTLKQITLNYQARGFKIMSVFWDGTFEHLTNWTKSELQIDLVTCAADLHVSRAKNTIRLVKERLKSIQSETPFTKYPKRLTIDMTKCTIVLINSSRRKSGVHFVISPRQIIFERKSKLHYVKWEN